MDIIKVKSKYDFDGTVDKILDALKSKNVSVFATVDHKKNAETVNMKMESEKLILFGSPAVGTPLMNENNDIGIELPSKLLIYKKDNDIYVVYKDPEILMKEYNIKNSKENLIKLKNLIESIIKCVQ